MTFDSNLLDFKPPVLVSNLDYPSNLPDEIRLTEGALASYKNVVPFSSGQVIRRGTFSDVEDERVVVIPVTSEVEHSVVGFTPMYYGLRLLIGSPTEGQNKRIDCKIKLTTIFGLMRYDMELRVKDINKRAEMIFFPYYKVDNEYRSAPFFAPVSELAKKEDTLFTTESIKIYYNTPM